MAHSLEAKSLRLLMLLGAVLLAGPRPAAGVESIVGLWATPGRCGVPLSTVAVEALAFSGEDFTCAFTSVARQSDVIRWTGRCTFGGDPARPARVTARLRKGRLFYRIDGDGWNGPLQRCSRRD